MTRTRMLWAGVLAILLIMVTSVTLAGAASAGKDKGHDKDWICHPVNGRGETGTGWNLIDPSRASSHIDEATGAGKHTSHDGRTDVYANGNACPGGPQPDDTYPYEVSVCWTMSYSDGREDTYEWPQTRGCSEPTECGTSVEQQHDTYWIRDVEDERYLAGLTGLNSPADDARLEPHDYYSTILTAGDCPPISEPPVTEPPVTEPPVTEPPVTEPPVTEPPVTEPPVGNPDGPKPPRHTCETHPWTCDEPKHPTPEQPIPPKVGPPPTTHRTLPPSQRCIDQNTIRVEHADGTVTFKSDKGACDGDTNPPAKEEGF